MRCGAVLGPYFQTVRGSSVAGLKLGHLWHVQYSSLPALLSCSLASSAQCCCLLPGLQGDKEIKLGSCPSCETKGPFTVCCCGDDGVAQNSVTQVASL